MKTPSNRSSLLLNSVFSFFFTASTLHADDRHLAAGQANQNPSPAPAALQTNDQATTSSGASSAPVTSLAVSSPTTATNAQPPCPPPGTYAPASTQTSRLLGYLQSFHETLPLREARSAVGIEVSPQINYQNVFDRQAPVYRPFNKALDPSYEGVNWIFASQADIAEAQARLANGDTSNGSIPNGVLFNATGSARVDGLVTSTRLNDTNAAFLPSAIPARTDAYYKTGERADMIVPPAGPNSVVFHLVGNPADLGTLQTFAKINYSTDATGAASAQVQYLWGAFGNVILGQTDSTFGDVDAFPDLLDFIGPNAAVYLQRPLIGYYIQLHQSTDQVIYALVSAEKPNPSVNTMPSAITAVDKPGFYSQIPEFAAKIKVSDNNWGNLQIASIVRDIGVEDSLDHGRAQTVGWGSRFSMAVKPFQTIGCFKNDTVTGSIIYGQGIGTLVTDTMNVAGSDAVLNKNGTLNTTPLFAYYVGYTHHWTDQLTSTIVYSEVDLNSPASEGAATYRQGRYAAANLIYRWLIFPTKSTDANNKPVQPHTAFTGLELLYGEKDTIGNGHGSATRLDFATGVNF
jgi:hypothetical protein